MKYVGNAYLRKHSIITKNTTTIHSRRDPLEFLVAAGKVFSLLPSCLNIRVKKAKTKTSQSPSNQYLR